MHDLFNSPRLRVDQPHGVPGAMICQPLPDPLRTLVITTPLAIDLMFYEDKDWLPGV
jgi:hypothetical protein